MMATHRDCVSDNDKRCLALADLFRISMVHIRKQGLCSADMLLMLW
jgi:hypothetical protein